MGGGGGGSGDQRVSTFPGNGKAVHEIRAMWNAARPRGSLPCVGGWYYYFITILRDTKMRGPFSETKLTIKKVS